LKSGLIIAAHDRRALRALDEETSRLADDYGYKDVSHLDAGAIAHAIGTDLYPGGRLDAGGGHINPMKLAQGLAEAALRAGAKIYEKSKVRSLDRQQRQFVVHADTGSVQADRIAVALDAYSADLLPELAPYIGHVESFIVATAPLTPSMAELVLPSGVAVADTRHVLDYYRKSADDRLLFAGRESYWNVPADIARLVRPRMVRVFPRLAEIPIEFGWSGTVGITRTRMPHFGWLGERLAFAHGYSGHGVAMAVLGGRLLAEALLGRPERFEIMRRVPAKPFPGGRLLRRPLVSAGLYWFKLVDAI
jgi:gamma-glutamylputrescine oxidase